MIAPQRVSVTAVSEPKITSVPKQDAGNDAGTGDHPDAPPRVEQRAEQQCISHRGTEWHEGRFVEVLGYPPARS
jgi:hypothetical protein